MHLAGVFVTYFLVHLFQTAGTHNCTGSDSFRIPNFAYHGLAMPAVGLSLLPLSPSDEKLLVQVAGLDTDASTVTCRYGDAIYYPRQWELRRTALVSFPRSGNSWTRTLIQKASGYRTSSIYEEKRGKKPVLPFSEDRFLTKTHFPLYSNPGDPDKLRPRAQLKYFDQAIFLTRNPFDSLLSYFHYQNLAQNFTAKATLEHSSLSIIDMAIYIQDFKDFFNYWLKVPLPMKAVRYEDIKVSPADLGGG